MVGMASSSLNVVVGRDRCSKIAGWQWARGFGGLVGLTGWTGLPIIVARTTTASGIQHDPE
jgi:hypothetical protein